MKQYELYNTEYLLKPVAVCHSNINMRIYIMRIEIGVSQQENIYNLLECYYEGST